MYDSLFMHEEDSYYMNGPIHLFHSFRGFGKKCLCCSPSEFFLHYIQHTPAIACSHYKVVSFKEELLPSKTRKVHINQKDVITREKTYNFLQKCSFP
jgi:hypothetical protein